MGKKKTIASVLMLFLLYVIIFSVYGVRNVVAVNVESDSFQIDSIYSEDESSSGGGDVMGTSVVVTAPVTELEIIKIDTEKIYQDGNIKAKVTLDNLTEEEKLIDKVGLVVKKLDGSVVMLESINIDQEIKTEGETNFSLEFPGNLKEGKYIGVFELYSQDKFLGSSETVLSVSPSSPEVLGISTENYDYLLLTSLAIFAGVLIFSTFLLLKKKTLLLKGITIKIFDLIVIILGLSVFGIGVCSGYLLCKAFFPTGIYSAQKQESTESSSKISGSDSSNNEYNEFIYKGKSLQLFAKPDSSAEKTYEIKENANLKIIDQAAGWYRVLLLNGISGWVKIEEI